MHTAFRAGLSLSSLDLIQEPARQAGVTICVTTVEHVWLIERFDTDLACYEALHLFDMSLKGGEKQYARIRLAWI